MTNGGSDLPTRRDDFGGRVAHCKIQGRSVVNCAKTAESIEMPFGLWTRMDRRNRVLAWGPEMLRDVAMATNFATKIAINWLCVNDSDQAIGYGGGFEWRAD